MSMQLYALYRLLDSLDPPRQLHAGESGVRLCDVPDIKLFILVGRSFLSVTCPTGVQLVFIFCSVFQKVIQCQGIFIVGQLTESVESSFLIHLGGYHDLFVCP